MQKEKNKAGIYTIKFYIRGRPTLITIDDEFLFEKNFIQFKGSTNPTFAEMSDEYPSLWGLLIEKAWSKIQINYENSIAGGGY